MSIDGRSKLEHGQEGLSFATALRECLVCGVIFIDGEERITLVSAEAAQILGWPPSPTPGGSGVCLPAPLQKIAHEVLSSGRMTDVRQVSLVAGDREALTLRVKAVPLPPGTKDAGVLLVVNDLTPARRLEQNVWQVDRLANLGTLAASMAHEIKNALVAGKTFIDLLLEKHQDSELVEVVRREMGRIDAIVSRVLRFVGPARRGFATIHLHEVLEHSLRLVQPQLEGKSVALERSFQAAPDLLNGDEYELQQAFVNLLLNALEAMGPNGTLTVTTELVATGAQAANLRETAGPPELRVTIKDTGAGIPQENLDRLFEPFFTTKPSGTGLGLAITQRIIQEHRGQITVESQPGQGTTFRILLPVVAEEGASAKPVE